MTPIEKVADILKGLVRGMAEDPGAVRIVITHAESAYPVLTIQASAEDASRIIGPEGRRIKALRLVMDAVSFALKTKFTIQINRQGGV